MVVSHTNTRLTTLYHCYVTVEMVVYASCTWHTIYTRVFHCICVRYSITNLHSIDRICKMIAHNWYQPHDNCTKIVVLCRVAILRRPAHYTYASQVSSRNFWAGCAFDGAEPLSFNFCCFSAIRCYQFYMFFACFTLDLFTMHSWA